MLIYYVVAIVAVVFSSIAQLFLKIGTGQKVAGKAYVGIYFNWSTLLGVLLLFVVTLLSIYALQEIDLKEFVFILPMSYLFVPLLSQIYLKEKISARRAGGMFIIIVGIIFFNMDKWS